MSMRSDSRSVRLVATVLAAIAIGTAVRAHAGSTEPALAISRAVASVQDGAVNLEVSGNYDYGNVVRLGYPFVIVVTTSNAVARLALDGSVTLATGGGAPAPVAGARGVVAITPDRLIAALPPSLTAAGAATVQLEASFDGKTLLSNTVGVQW